MWLNGRIAAPQNNKVGELDSQLLQPEQRTEVMSRAWAAFTYRSCPARAYFPCRCGGARALATMKKERKSKNAGRVGGDTADGWYRRGRQLEEIDSAGACDAYLSALYCDPSTL